MARFRWSTTLASGETAGEALEALYYDGYTDEHIAALLSVMTGQSISMQSVRQKRRSMGLGKSLQGAPLVRPSTAPRYDKTPRIEGDCLILCDLQIPFHDAGWCNRCIQLALLWKVPNLILAGDILDLNALKHFAPFFAHVTGDKPQLPPATLEEELGQAAQVFDAFACFGKVLYISGGHELRLLRKLDSSLAISRLASMFTALPQLETSAYHRCEVGKNWLISHPKNTSVIPGRVPFFLVRKFRKNVAIGHDHVWGQVQDDSGENIAISIGVCCDTKRLDYVALMDSTRPAVSQGALIIKRGYPWLLSPKWSDFSALRTVKF